MIPERPGTTLSSRSHLFSLPHFVTCPTVCSSMKYSPSESGHFDGQRGYGYVSIEKFIDAARRLVRFLFILNAQPANSSTYRAVLTPVILKRKTMISMGCPPSPTRCSQPPFCTLDESAWMRSGRLESRRMETSGFWNEGIS